MPRARGVYYLGRDYLAVFYLVQLEALRMPEVLEDHLVFVISNSYLHVQPPFNSTIKYVLRPFVKYKIT